MSKRRKRKKRASPKAIWLTAAFTVIIFSIVVRWWDFREGIPIQESTFQIEVLNGSGEAGIAMRTAMELRKAGIDVLVIGDAEHYNFEESILVDRTGNPELMTRLARLTGCRKIVEQRQGRPLVDATFIVGRDMIGVKIGD
jgi:hypothetical protein